MVEATHRPVTSFVRRSPRMNDSQRAALLRLGGRFLLDGLQRDTMETLFVAQQPIDLDRSFGRHAPLLVEIGCGSGENLAAAATASPDWNLLGFEVYDKVLASTMSRLERADAGNVRLVRGDAVTGFQFLLAPGSITELHTYFPDPWHKARHAKRRLINPGFVTLAASRLLPGRLWRLATDWDDYAAHIRGVFADDAVAPLFDDVTGSEAGWQRPQTKFEARAHAAGRIVTEIVYRRTAVSAGGSAGVSPATGRAISSTGDSTGSARGSAGVSPATGSTTGEGAEG